jgi:succinoglycan biosynthesis protein ExoO
LDAAILSARRQSLAEIEILVVDDQSTDGSRACALRHAEADARVRVLNGPGNGPGGARNVALRQARGEWVAILDGDDFMHPRRLERLLSEAALQRVDMIADNLFVFHDPQHAVPTGLMLTALSWRHRRRIDLVTYLRSNVLMACNSPLGYLKPVIRRQALEDSGIAYDESLRIAEDCDLVAQLLASGARFGYVPDPLYFYRRHDLSTSYRITSADISAMIAAAGRFHASLDEAAEAHRAASRHRLSGLHRAHHFTLAREQLKARRWLRALRTALAHLPSSAIIVGAVRDTINRRLRERRSHELSQRNRGAVRHRKALLLWSGAHGAAERLATSLSAKGFAATIVMVRATTDAAAFRIPVGLLCRIAGEAPVDLILYNNDLARELVPYALSPTARSMAWREEYHAPLIQAGLVRSLIYEREQFA